MRNEPNQENKGGAQIRPNESNGSYPSFRKLLVWLAEKDLPKDVVTSFPVLERNDITNKPNHHTSCQDHER